MEQPREYKHLGNPPGQDSRVRYASFFFRQRPNAYKFRPLFNTSKKGSTKYTREGMADKKSRTPPSSARKIYGEVPEKYATPYFAKVLVAGNKTTKYLSKYGGDLHGKRDMCMHHILEKCRNPNLSFYHAQAK